MEKRRQNKRKGRERRKRKIEGLSIHDQGLMGAQTVSIQD